MGSSPSGGEVVERRPLVHSPHAEDGTAKILRDTVQNQVKALVTKAGSAESGLGKSPLLRRSRLVSHSFENNWIMRPEMIPAKGGWGCFDLLKLITSNGGSNHVLSCIW